MAPPAVALGVRVFNGQTWQLLGRSLGQSFRLTHLVLGLGCALVVLGGAWLLDQIWNSVLSGSATDEAMSSPFKAFSAFWPTGGASNMDDRTQVFATAVRSTGWSAGLVLAGAILISSIFLGAIARSTAKDLSSGRSLGIIGALRFAASRWKALSGAILIPLILVALGVALIQLFGLLFFSTKVASPVGGLLYILPLVTGLAVSLIVFAMVFGHCMLAPASMIEDSDGLDAIQRSLAYLVARPIRFVAYALLAVSLLYVSYLLLQEVLRLAIGLASSAQPTIAAEENRWFMERAMTVWVQLIWLAFIGWVISFYGSASTILYLLMRHACDGQDVSIIADSISDH